MVVALATELGVAVEVKPADLAPLHPGRCAQIFAGGQSLGFAGEIAPRVITASELPARTVAAEINLDLLIDMASTSVSAPKVWTFPIAKEDIALVVDQSVEVAQVISCIKQGAGELLEEVRLFDIYTGSPIPEGKKSLAFSLKFRAPDRTLSAQEVADARISAVTKATEQFGAVLRG